MSAPLQKCTTLAGRPWATPHRSADHDAVAPLSRGTSEAKRNPFRGRRIEIVRSRAMAYPRCRTWRTTAGSIVMPDWLGRANSCANTGVGTIAAMRGAVAAVGRTGNRDDRDYGGMFAVGSPIMPARPLSSNFRSLVSEWCTFGAALTHSHLSRRSQAVSGSQVGRRTYPR